MPVIHLQNVSLDNQFSEEQSRVSSRSDATSAISNLLDSIKLSSKMNRSIKKRVPIDPSALELEQSSTKTDKTKDMQSKSSSSIKTFTAITESLSASSEDISDALGKTFGMFTATASNALKETQNHDFMQDDRQDSCRMDPSRSSASSCARDDEDRALHASASSGTMWTALAAPTGFRHSRSAPMISEPRLVNSWEDTCSWDDPARSWDDAPRTNTQRTNKLLHTISSKTFETDYTMGASTNDASCILEGMSSGTTFTGGTWDEDESRDVSLLDTIDDEEVVEFESEEDDSDSDDGSAESADTFRSNDSDEPSPEDLFGNKLLTDIVNKLGACAVQNQVNDEAYTATSAMLQPNGGRGRSRSPRTPVRIKQQFSEETVRSYLGFNEQRELRRLAGDSTKRAPLKGFFESVFSCGGPVP
jgi:hypothetical protein